jgi:hypothetical protein
VVRLRDLGIAFSDRRAVKVLKLIAASAVLCGRQQAIGADLWVLRYVWDRVEQIAPLECWSPNYSRLARRTLNRATAWRGCRSRPTRRSWPSNSNRPSRA